MSLRTTLFAPLLLAALLLPAARAADDPDLARLRQRVVALDADPQLNPFAAYERLRARQALDALAQARSRDRDGALYVAERRVQIAEIAARAEAAERETDRLERERAELLVEASRQDAARARAEAERLRLQAQMQAEEAERLRQQQAADALAMQDVETALQGVAGAQAARLNAAREREARLAREEAELVTGGKLPASKRDGRGEVFSLAKGAFGAGKAALSGDADKAVRTVAAYVQASSAAGGVRVEVTAADAKLAQRRAAAVREALAAGGVAADRVQVSGRSGKSEKTELIVVSK
ncbi:OmpA family protein [Vulcaniibacterium tengchongense]|uniref:OmpA family protein n=1 Tax=Vulcaniibacterium tengchongense TaxID=1273429 RepID=A0A3N4VDN9_9GAMM|nr:OmpA family protein [Vulcaniibacterium tengchongense]RPE79605.1 OmpA family protein [Vulcaniibacterium tengchongense]